MHVLPSGQVLSAPKGLDLSESQSRETNSIVGALCAVSTVAVALRFISRTKIQRLALNLDDWLILSALVGAL